MPSMIDAIQHWCALAGFGCQVVDAATPFRLLVTIADDAGALTLTVDGPATGEDPLRLRYGFGVATSPAGPIPAERLVRLLDAAVMQRSAMVDARPAGPDQVEMVVALYPDGVTRHGFMIGVFECQKLREIVRREVEGALSGDAAVAALTALADASDGLSDAIDSALPT